MPTKSGAKKTQQSKATTAGKKKLQKGTAVRSSAKNKKNNTANKKNTGKNGVYNNKSAVQASEPNPMRLEIVFLVVIVFSLIVLLSLFGLCGSLGELIANLHFGLYGLLAYIMPFVYTIAFGFILSNIENSRIIKKTMCFLGLLFSIGGFIQWVANTKTYNLAEVYKYCSESKNGGGFFGGILANLLSSVLGRVGSIVIIFGLIVLFIMLISGKQIFSLLININEHDYENDADYEKYDDNFIEYEDYKNKNTRKKKAVLHNLIDDDNAISKREHAVEKAPKLKPEEPKNNISIIRSGESTPVYKEELKNKFGDKSEPVVENTQSTKVKTSSAKTSSVKTPEVVAPKPEEKKASKPANSSKEEIQSGINAVAKEITATASEEKPYKFPPLDLLSSPKANANGTSDEELIATAEKLQHTLKSFGVNVTMGDVSCGPSVTRYELVPEEGVKVSKITSLTDDIKLSLAASDIRIEAPIPGKAAVGIEVPNSKRSAVTLRELLESSEFKKAKSNVTFAVGKDIGGKTIVTDIAKMPHLLVAGATGSGKSVCINTLIMSIIYKANPNDVKFIMVDPKMVELTAYADIPHLMIPVVTDPKKASAALNWAVVEMNSRYEKFAEVGVRDIKSFNKKIEGLTFNDGKTYEKMCQIVIIVDEFADLMMVAPGEVEDAVCRLAQLARAAGIHLVLATQRPSVNVITGLIKANVPSRIALSVSSQVDSRTIIDGAGAEKLLGNGDMLFAPQELPQPIRVQGAFVSDEERDGVISFLREQAGGASYNQEIASKIETAHVESSNGAGGAATNANDNDELFVDAARFIIEKDKASIGLLQRAFRIGFNRAARIMD
nr:DNA translocase FtsK [Eubacterium sp.]